MSNTRAVWFFVLGLTTIRLTLLSTTDLTFDEAHYWMWSERLAPSYFSKGPGVAFAIRASTWCRQRAETFLFSAWLTISAVENRSSKS